jgi:hypothetical protein
MYLNITASKDTYIHNKILANRYRTSDSNVGVAGTLDLFKLYGESTLPEIESVTQSEIVSITFPAHEDSNLDSKYFILYDETDIKYYVWFNVTDAMAASVDPAIAGATAIQTDIAVSASNVQVAAAITLAVDAQAKFSVEDKLSGEVEITVIAEEPTLNASNGNISDDSFELTITQHGNNPGTYNLDIDSDGHPDTAIELSRILLGFDLDELADHTTLDVTDSDFKATLQLFDILDGQMAPTNFNVEIFPLAKTFTEGIGRDTGAFNDLDICNFVTSSYSSTPVLWGIPGANKKGPSDAEIGEDIDVFASGAGGEQYYVTKEFVEGTESFTFDVTDIIKAMVLGDISNHGLRISLSELEEQDGKTYFLKRFASRHVLNQYLKPRLSVSWNDSYRDNSKNSIFDTSSTLIFQNTVRGTTTFATGYEYEVDGNSDSLALTISTGSYTQTFAAERAKAYGTLSNEIEGVYSASFTLDTLDGAESRVTSQQEEIIRIELIDHDTDSENLLGYYFTISNNESEPATYDFWFGIDGDDAPVAATNNPTQITIASADVSATIATLTSSAIDAVTGMTSTVYSLGVVHVALDTKGSPANIASVGTIDDEDFSITRYQEGSSLTLQDHIIASGSISFDTTWSGNSSADGTGTDVTLLTGSVIVNTPIRSAFNATRRNLIFSLLNAKQSYKVSEKAKLRVFSRDLNQELSSAKVALEIDSVIFDKMYYRIRDVSSGDLIIPFEKDNNGTRLSTDSAGMYFELSMASLFPGRSYTVDLLVVSDGNESVFECKNTRFRVDI